MSELNHVELVGRVSVDPVERVLPSGDRLVSFRVVVPRSGGVLRRSRQKVDVVECAVWTVALQRKARKLVAGDEVRVAGELRRRFSRASPGSSWFAVDLVQLNKAPPVISGP